MAEAEPSPSNTLIQKDGLHEPTGHLQCWLADDQYIYPLKVGLNTVGRSSDNDVVAADCFISRRHCAILMHTQQECELHDTASKNGTFLNGARIAHPTSLKSGDTIRICDRQFVFVCRGDARCASGFADRHPVGWRRLFPGRTVRLTLRRPLPTNTSAAMDSSTPRRPRTARTLLVRLATWAPA